MFKLVLNYIIKMKKNTMVCLSGLIVSIVLLFSLIQIGYMIMDSYQTMMTSNSNYDLMISDLTYKQIKEISSDFKDKCQLSSINFFADCYENETITNYVVGVEGEWLKTFSVKLVDGKTPAGINRIAVEERYAKSHGLKLGDSLSLTLSGEDGEETAEFSVCGIVSDTPSYTNGTYMFVSMEQANDILEKNVLYAENPEYTSYFLMDEHGYPEEEIEQVYDHMFHKYGKEILAKITVNPTKYKLYNDDKGLFSGMSSAIAGIVVFISFIMMIFIYYMMNINLQAKYKQYGIIRAIGAKKHDIAMLIGFELFIYSIVSLILGCLGGVVFNKLFASKIIHILLGKNIEVNGIRNYMIIIYMILIVAVSNFLVWLIFVHKLRNKPPIDLIQKKEMLADKKLLHAKNIYVDLIVNNCYRNRKNSRALIITMILASLLTILFINGISSISFDVNKSIFAFSNCEVTVALGNVDHPYFTAAELKEMNSDVDDIYMQSSLKNFYEDICVNKGNQQVEDCGVIIYSDNLMEKLIEINRLDKNCHVIVCGDAITKNEKFDISLNGKKYAFCADETVSDEFSSLRGQITDDYKNAVIIGESYAKAQIGFRDEWNDILLKGSIDSDELTDILGKNNFIYYDLSSIVDQSQSQMQSILVLMAYMACSVVFLSIFLIRSIVKESFEHRKKEIGMMCAIGTRKNQMTRILMGETLLLVVLAGVIAVIISIPISMYVYNIMNGKIGIPWQGYGIGIPLMILLSGFVIWCNVRGCMKEKITVLMKCEE